MYHKHLSLSFILVFFLVVNTFGQRTGNSPYSTFGIGDLEPKGYIRNLGMGGVGLALGNPEYINILNPALLASSRYKVTDSVTVRFSILEAGFTGQTRNLQTQLARQTSSGINFGYFVFLFPVSKKWSTSVGLRPFSGIQNIGRSETVVNDTVPVLSFEESIGSVNQFHFSNGFNISKKFSLGLHLAYLFGNSTSESLEQTFFIPFRNTPPNKVGLSTRMYFSGFQVRPGMAFRQEIKNLFGSGKEGIVSLGVTYDHFFNTKSRIKASGIIKNEYDAVISDTINIRPETTSNINLPGMLSWGIGVERPDVWSAGFDFSYTPWSQYKGIDDDILRKNSYTFALGGEYKLGRTENLRRKVIRAGVNYSKTPIFLANEQIEDMSFSIGGTVPFGRKDPRFKTKPLTKLTIAFIAGQRGKVQDFLVKETYFKLYLGILISDRWFQRWKIE